ncbi:MAG: amidophosphoribosyltransferase, amidophosphoribosyltransferase [Candidatus Peregrinibacteria bacterium GW2011_GWF2_38_29]|nr:MAG: amidophosphoribosyltransferase, amidophosphoribosyltransferase [Candidatus Peregrinibacteria bacterium GW2011_GWF2_38_29]HBB02678.1 amidophosphoribosyltransferase [Candidatus Peregrinibacteria bacterium]
MCGVVGIFGNDYVAQDMYDALICLQHRGQDATGIITYDGEIFHTQKDLGLVRDVFHTRHMQKLLGYVAIGHTRYSTIGGGAVEDAQPFLSQSFGVMLAHNGNVFNSYDLKKELLEHDHRLVNSNCDAEIILQLFTKELARQNDKSKKSDLSVKQISDAVKSVYARARGAYSVVSYIANKGMVAFRDPYGIRPLLFGKRKNGLAYDYIFASESIVLDVLGFEFVSDVGPGEMVFIDEKTRAVHHVKVMPKTLTPCVFEYIYFARPDSVLNGISVYKAQMRMGEKLADKVKKLKLDIDVVMPVPDSSRAAAVAMADRLGIKYREGLVKNRYIGRTFIMPGQKIRKKSIQYKLNPMKLEITGKKILLVDDSIVRGNTSKQIVQMIRNAGAKKIYLAIFSPPIINPCLYGIDIPTREELIASSFSVEQVRKFTGADALIYADLKDVFEACISGNPNVKDMCMACFDGKYKTGDIDEKVLKKNAASRLNDKSCGQIEEEFETGPEKRKKGQLNLV